MKIEIFPSARTRIKEIRRYTRKSWGKKQADTYIRGLGQAISEIPKRRDFWRPVDDEVMRDTFFIRYERHYIFFRTFANRNIGIISVLHDSMDIPSRLKEDRGLTRKRH